MMTPFLQSFDFLMRNKKTDLKIFNLKHEIIIIYIMSMSQ